jgi:MucR family transcriptional regulator, transcriptional regulator of exopolysaccharide biosynthesis
MLEKQSYRGLSMTTKSTDVKVLSDMFIAYVGSNKVEPGQIEGVVRALDRALSSDEQAETTSRDPAVSIDESITPNYLICLEDGKKFRSLKRHIGMHGMTPDEYRAKWDLASDYPMVAPRYSKVRSRLAKKIGLGRKRSAR